MEKKTTHVLFFFSLAVQSYTPGTNTFNTFKYFFK